MYEVMSNTESTLLTRLHLNEASSIGKQMVQVEEDAVLASAIESSIVIESSIKDRSGSLRLDSYQQDEIVKYLPDYKGVRSALSLNIAVDGLLSNFELGRPRGLPRIYVGYDQGNKINSIINMDDDTIKDFALFIFSRQELFQDSVLDMSEGSFKHSEQWHAHIHINNLILATIEDIDYFGLAVRQAGIFAGAKIHLATPTTTERSVLKLVSSGNKSFSIKRDFDGFVFDLFSHHHVPDVHMWWKHDGKNQKWEKSMIKGPSKSFQLYSKMSNVYIYIENGVISLTRDCGMGQLFNESDDGELLIDREPVYVSTSVINNRVFISKTENEYFNTDLNNVNRVISEDYIGENLEKIRNWKTVLESNFAKLEFDTTLPFNLIKHNSYPLLGLQMKGEYNEMDEDTKMQKMKELLRGLKIFFATVFERNNSPDFEGNPLQNLSKLLPGAVIVINIAGFINDGKIPTVITEHLSDESWKDLGISNYIYLEPWTYYLYLKIVHGDDVLNDWYSNYCNEGINFIPW